MARLTVAVVCGAGLGTSLMAKMAVDGYLRERKIPSRTECWDVGSAKSLDVDVLVTTDQLARAIRDPRAKKVLIVKSFLNRDELKGKLTQAIDELKAEGHEF